jgi:hypothetical protein
MVVNIYGANSFLILAMVYYSKFKKCIKQGTDNFDTKTSLWFSITSPIGMLQLKPLKECPMVMAVTEMVPEMSVIL